MFQKVRFGNRGGWRHYDFHRWRGGLNPGDAERYQQGYAKERFFHRENPPPQLKRRPGVVSVSLTLSTRDCCGGLPSEERRCTIALYFRVNPFLQCSAEGLCH